MTRRPRSLRDWTGLALAASASLAMSCASTNDAPASWDDVGDSTEAESSLEDQKMGDKPQKDIDVIARK